MRDPYLDCKWILREDDCTHEASSVASAFWRALNCSVKGKLDCYDPYYSEEEPLETWTYHKIREELADIGSFDDLCDWLYTESTMESMEWLRRSGE